MANYKVRVEEVGSDTGYLVQRIAPIMDPKEYAQRVYPDAMHNALPGVYCNRIPSEYKNPTATAELTQDEYSQMYDVEDSGGQRYSYINTETVDVSNFSEITVMVNGHYDPAGSLIAARGIYFAEIDHVQKIRKAPFLVSAQDVDLEFADAEIVYERAFYKNPAAVVELPKCTRVSAEAFRGMTYSDGVTIELPVVQVIGERAFYGSKLATLGLDQVERVPALGDGALDNCPELATIRVPSALLEDFQHDAAWSAYSSCFVSV